MFRQFRSEVEAALADALDSLALPTDDLGIERPPDDMDATLASSVAFRLAGEVGDAPPNVAATVAEAVSVGNADYVASVDTAGPYVNFHANERYLADTLDAAAVDADYGALPDRDTSVVVEHTSANPTGPVHVGRARNPIVGDAVANLLAYAGYDVDRHYYVNDAGRQMAVFTWAYERFDESDLDAEPARDRAEYDLVRYYRKGNAFLEEADDDAVEAAEAEIQSILQGLEAGDEETYERVGEVVDAVLGGMKACLGRLPAEFDEFVKETRFMRDGSTDDIAGRLKETDHAVYEEDAWQLELDEWGIDKNLVFLRSDDTSLYTTRDLAHHEWKFANYDRAVTVLGEDHKLQADQLDATLELLGNDTDRLGHVIYSYVNLPEGKMSTRRGTGVMLDDLLDEAIDRARDAVESRMDDRIRDDDLTDEDVERIAHQVGIGAVRYDIVSKQPAKAITFEWEDALDFEAQSAPFVQYVHARCAGILGEAAAAGIDVPGVTADADGEVDPDALDVDAGALETDAARELLREVARFPAAIEAAADDLEPHTIATFTREFADAYNAFYRECPVVTAETEALRDARLALVAAAKHTMANALDVLGVEAPESM
ncbi:arginyl-tRNA synthetase [Halorubrum ezzemoulense]|uniref:Arginine--tRNA ligase n=1 Tax=Halorubrum ezzemoulense TaxID=337243 RepID=A0A238XGF6_HALEZ|nr:MULTISPECIES: arginine--tRNA ligase [Halorubrum]MDB2242116.1 arginine--tRNA ligase [Halorubrum ezzemoulense]MDB9280782.1 arginine--tRNA ligase [Halorubrum ezzemoulense]MDB9284039.1 arginine--tRNA ligase [Halorubrum ezzemoulense]TKX38868.1 arginine--tRNA ligase [Halorubrum sp. CGM5_25_10-8B]TKX41163.1 arginine--tRNA ligase [Halorubrum sp. CGM4_25_10-8A]